MESSQKLRSACPTTLAKAMEHQRKSTLLALVTMDPGRWWSPCMAVVNPPLWEIGHVGWFQERWCLRERPRGLRPSILAKADKLYHSAKVAHDTRWQLDLLKPKAVLRYLERVMDKSLDHLSGLTDDSPELYFYRLNLFHEMMHRESFCHSWQTLGYESPSDLDPPRALGPTRWLGIPKGEAQLGSPRDSDFVFDNEKWGKPVSVPAFQVANRVLTNREFIGFIRAGGYQTEQYWPADIWKQMQLASRRAPSYWRVAGESFEELRFGQWVELDPDRPLTHVTLFEAEAYCRWSGCRLPTEVEWVHAASQPDFEWGDVWEWTSSIFRPFDGFTEDPYAEYSSPWFHTHQVLKGASLATPDGLKDIRFRNYYEPERFDVFNGFRVVKA